MFVIMKCLLSILLAVGGGLLGSRWIAYSYQKAAEGVLSFPDRAEEQHKKRPLRLGAVLGFLFCFTLLTLHSMHPLRVGFLMVFQYFLLLYTWTDLEQRVIFDKMLLPFVIIGAISIPVLERVPTDHIEAAVVGGLVFLALAVITKGGIGGGDVKLIAALGIWLGTDMLMTVVIAGIVMGGIAALLMLATGKRKKGDFFAYGPYFTISALVFTLL
ncbi:prepilin peptidase [Mitsuokella sp. WILCCON 0060]|uniref:prepilin peptidase n=1 Tax=unclassified Mitsuokella TaxID=2637239 RepID=UPI003F065B30